MQQIFLHIRVELVPVEVRLRSIFIKLAMVSVSIDGGNIAAATREGRETSLIHT